MTVSGKSGMGQLMALLTAPGLGDTTAPQPMPPVTNPSSYTFGQGFSVWFQSPGTAVGLIPQAFGNLNKPVAWGILAVPVMAVAVIWYMNRK